MTIPEHFHEERREAIAAMWKVHKGKKWVKVRPILRAIHAEYREKVQTLIDQIVGHNVSALDADDFYYQTSDANILFYVKTADVAATLLSNNPNVFHTYCAPRSEAVEARMKELAGQKVEVREKHWFNEYDHRITFKWQANYAELDARVKGIKFVDSLYSESDTRVLYVSGEDDFFLAKLALSDRIETVTRSIVVDQIEGQNS